MEKVYEREVLTLEFSSASSDEEDRPPPKSANPRVSLSMGASSTGSATSAAKGKGSGRGSSKRKDSSAFDDFFDMSELKATQKKKRVVKSAEAAAATPRKVAAFPVDAAGQPILPLTVGVVTLHETGRIVHDRPTFHNKRYIWPVGFHSSRLYLSAVDAEQQATYHSRILDGGTGPIFDVYADDNPEQRFQSPTPTGAWTAIVKQVNALRGREYANSASGPDFFGLSNPTISMIIENLPEAKRCTQYQRKVYETSISLKVNNKNAGKSSSKRASEQSTSFLESDMDHKDEDDDDDDEHHLTRHNHGDGDDALIDSGNLDFDDEPL